MRTGLMTVRPHWLNEDRVTIYSRVFAVFNTAALVCIVIFAINGVTNVVVGGDFLVFWSASNMALHGHAADAYDPLKLLTGLQSTVPGLHNVQLFWAYPPTYYLLALPLAWLPYLLSYCAFAVTTFAAFMTAMRQILPGPRMILPVVAFPAVHINAVYGQNGFLTAALAGFALLLLDKKPLLAGVLIGLLTIKPQFAALFFVALLVSGRWKMFIAAATTAVALLATSYGVFGPGVFTAFLRGATVTREALESGVMPWVIMPTVFASFRLLGAPLLAAYVGQVVVATFATGTVAFVWRRSSRVHADLRAAAVMTGAFLFSPYGYYYDLVWLAFPIAWVALQGMSNRWLPWEREILFAAWLLPVIMPLASVCLSLQIGPFIVVALLWVILRRILSCNTR